MDKKIVGLLSAAAALSTIGSAQASSGQVADLAPVVTYQDLLADIPNPVPVLRADDARRSDAGRTQVAQVSVGVGVSHHHHHHHHHHQHGVTVRLGNGHHHYHHHHHTTVIHHD